MPRSRRTMGAVIVVRAAHYREAETLFKTAGFTPQNITPRPDGNLDFVFGPEVEPSLWTLAHAIPDDFHAFRAVVGPDDPRDA